MTHPKICTTFIHVLAHQVSKRSLSLSSFHQLFPLYRNSCIQSPHTVCVSPILLPGFLVSCIQPWV